MEQPIERLSADIKKITILSSIANAVSKNSLSIAEISRMFSLNRSTTRYYLGLLKEDRMIILERQEHLPGRPTYIKIDTKAAEQYGKDMNKKFKEYCERMKVDPTVKEILFFLQKQERATEKEIMQHIKDKNFDDLYITKTLSALSFLKEDNRIINEWVFLK